MEPTAADGPPAPPFDPQRYGPLGPRELDAAHRFVEAEASVLDVAGLDAPSLSQGRNAWPALTEWAERSIRSLGTIQAHR